MAIPTKIVFHQWRDMGSLGIATVPGDDEVHLWTAMVPAPETEMTSYERLLDESEQARARRLKVPRVLNEFVFGRAVLRLLLGAASKQNPSAILFATGNHGKPRLAGIPGETDLRFNLSHSNGMIAIALSVNREVGVDIEWMERTIDWTMIARRAIPENWRSRWCHLSPDQQRHAFFSAWTIKEAYLKATGDGLGGTLPATVTNMDPECPPGCYLLSPKDDASGAWEFHKIPLPFGYAGTLVVER